MIASRLTAEIDIEDAKVLIERWNHEASELEEKAQALRSKASTLSAKMNQSEIDELLGVLPVARLGKTRAPRGENLQKIRAFLAEEGPQTTSQISVGTGLKTSSVSSVLNLNKGTVFSTDGRVWIIKPD